MIGVSLRHASKNAATACTLASFHLACAVRAQLTCLCSDMVTTLWCLEPRNNKESSRSSCPNISSSTCHTGAMHSTGRRPRGQDPEQNCEKGHTSMRIKRKRIEYEADPRHAELITHQLGLRNSSRSMCTPNEKSKPGVDMSTCLRCTGQPR